MTERRTSFEYEDLLSCGRGELFGAGNAQLPLPPMLMFDRISLITETGGAHGKGQVVAEFQVAGNDQADAQKIVARFFERVRRHTRPVEA